MRSSGFMGGLFRLSDFLSSELGDMFSPPLEIGASFNSLILRISTDSDTLILQPAGTSLFCPLPFYLKLGVLSKPLILMPISVAELIDI